MSEVFPMREIPDHATFREKENTQGWLDKLGGFLYLTLCNLANFDQLCLTKYRCYNLVRIYQTIYGKWAIS